MENEPLQLTQLKISKTPLLDPENLRLHESDLKV